MLICPLENQVKMSRIQDESEIFYKYRVSPNIFNYCFEPSAVVVVLPEVEQSQHYGVSFSQLNRIRISKPVNNIFFINSGVRFSRFKTI